MHAYKRTLRIRIARSNVNGIVAAVVQIDGHDIVVGKGFRRAAQQSRIDIRRWNTFGVAAASAAADSGCRSGGVGYSSPMAGVGVDVGSQSNEVAARTRVRNERRARR